MKYNLTYYQHYSDSHNQPEMKLLRAKYGWAGEGKYWALKNIIASSDNCLLDISNPLSLGMYAADLDMEYEEFRGFLDFLCSRDCGLLIRVDGYVTALDINETFQTVMKQRKAARERKIQSLRKQSDGEYRLFEISNS